jgi:hypothetical protein
MTEKKAKTATPHLREKIRMQMVRASAAANPHSLYVHDRGYL